LVVNQPKQSKGVYPPPPPEAALELNNGTEAIAVEFTDERLRAHAGSASFWSWLCQNAKYQRRV
jgi:hypothetical protein